MVKINTTLCDGCGTCVSICPTGALYMDKESLKVHEDRCCDSGRCVDLCPVAALKIAR